MTEREEVALSLESEFGTYVWSELRDVVVDALISREMRVRELEDHVKFLIILALHNGAEEPAGGVINRARLALNSKK